MTTDQTNSRTWAKLLYRTPENQPYDVAVLRVNPQDMDPSLRPLRLSRVPVVKGKYFALFSIFLFFNFISNVSKEVNFNSFHHVELLSKTFRMIDQEAYSRSFSQREEISDISSSVSNGFLALQHQEH